MAKRDEVIEGDVDQVVLPDTATVSVVANGKSKVSVPASANTPGTKVIVKGITIQTF